ARTTGYTETILGRRRYLPDLTSDNRQRRENAERVALNSPIQGSAADIIKLAMLRVESRMRAAERSSRMRLQGHGEAARAAAARRAARGRWGRGAGGRAARRGAAGLPRRADGARGRRPAGRVCRTDVTSVACAPRRHALADQRQGC